MWRLPLLLLAALALNSLTSCAASTTATAPVKSASEYCLIAKPITYAEMHEGDGESALNLFDSLTTIKQIKDHDIAWESVCGSKTGNQ